MNRNPAVPAQTGLLAAGRHRPGHDHDQGTRAPRVQHGGSQGPVQNHIAQTSGQLQAREHSQPAGLAAQRRNLMQAPRQHSQHCQHQVRHEPMGEVNGRQRRKANRLARLGEPQFAPDLKALRKVHHRPPTALTHREIGAGQHGVIGADPAAQRHLQRQQCKRAP